MYSNSSNNNNNSNKSRAFWAPRFIMLGAVLGIALAAFRAEAAPFAYVTNQGDGTVSVIDTATTPPKVVKTVAVGPLPTGVAVTPDGTHAYVTKLGNPGTVAVIDTANDPMETRAITVGISPRAVAFTPNGQHAYVLDVVVDAGRSTGNVSVIETATKKVVAEVRVATPLEVAVNPHGKHAYVIDTAHNTVVSPTILNDSPRTFWNHAWISKNCDNTYDRDPGNDQFYARYSSVAPFGQKGTVDLRV